MAYDKTAQDTFMQNVMLSVDLAHLPQATQLVTDLATALEECQLITQDGCDIVIHNANEWHTAIALGHTPPSWDPTP